MFRPVPAPHPASCPFLGTVPGPASRPVLSPGPRPSLRPGPCRSLRPVLRPVPRPLLRPALPLALRLFFVFLVFLVFLAAPPGGEAQLAPDTEWETRTTDHFRVTYPERLPELGERAALRAEAAYDLLAGSLVQPPEGRIDVLVTDHTDLSNGAARVFPTNQVVVVATPPMDRLSLSHFDDWLELVLVHELAHVFHLDDTGPLGSAVRAVFGRAPLRWPVFPGLATPGWTREGLATWYESDLTSAGRSRGSYFDMVLRTAVLEDAFEDPDEAAGSSPVWPDGERAYVYGAGLLRDLTERHGSDGMTEFVQSYSDAWIPFRVGSAMEDAFDVELDDAWETWRSELEAESAALRASLERRAPLTRTEEITHHGRWALRPLPSPDGRHVAYVRSDGISDPQIRLLPAPGTAGSGTGVEDGTGGTDGEGVKLTRTSGLADFAWAPDGSVVFSQLEHADRYRLYSDLYRVDLDGDVRRITREERLDHPHVAPDGQAAVAVQAGEGTNRLVEVRLEDGSVRPLTPFDPDVHWAYPRISPDGSRIAVSRWVTGGFFDVVLLDRRGGLLKEVTRSRAVDVAPDWSADGRWLLWSTDRSGIWNVVAIPTDSLGRSGGAAPGGNGGAAPPGLLQLTNVLTGALFPSVGPDGRWLYFSAYHADGWRIERIPFEPERGLDPFPPDPEDEAVPPTSPAADARDTDVPGEVAPFSPFPTILPRYWLPDIGVGEETLVGAADGAETMDVFGVRLGALTSGRDAVGRHAYAARAGLWTRDGRFQGAVSYSYAGLGNPVLGGFVYQGWDAPPRSVQAQGPGGEVEDLVPIERERGAGLLAGVVRRRYRDVLGLTLAGSYIRERTTYLSRGPDGTWPLEESARFRPLLPDRDLLELGVTFFGDRTRRHPFSISLEDGVQGHLTLRGRSELGLPESFGSVAGVDRSFVEALAELRAYQAFEGPGFANHVLALRGTAAAAGGPDALAFHFEVGGNRGRSESFSGFGLFGGESAPLPVRGFAEGARFGRYAWSAAAEYRFPLLVVHEGLGSFPLHLDRIAGSLFFDAGNAWGPRLAGGAADPVLPYDNPRRSALASGGAELSVIVLPLWLSDVVVRTGVAVPLSGGRGASLYLRLGTSF